MRGFDMDALAKVSSMSREEIHAQSNALYIREAEDLAETTLVDPYSVGGRGSSLEGRLARTVLALLEAHAASSEGEGETP